MTLKVQDGGGGGGGDMREKQLAPRDSFGSLACIGPFPSHWPGYDSVWMEQQCLPQATEK